MTVAEIMEQQRKSLEVIMAARKQRAAAVKQGSPTPPPPPKKMTPVEVERAFIEDRTYDGKPPEGGMYRTIRKESPEEYVARDGTRTFVPWRYVSMQDLELPDNGNPYRKPNEDDTKKRLTDPWGRPSGYVGSAAGPDMSPEYDPWSMSADTPTPQGGQGGGWDDWLAPAPMQQPAQQPDPASQWDSWMAPTPEQQSAPTPAPGPTEAAAPVVDTNGTLDIMRNMRP